MRRPAVQVSSRAGRSNVVLEAVVAFSTAVSTDVSVVSANAGNGRRSTKKRESNSAARGVRVSACAAAVTGNEELAACTQRSLDGVRDRGDQTAKLTILRSFLQGGERWIEKTGY